MPQIQPRRNFALFLIFLIFQSIFCLSFVFANSDLDEKISEVDQGIMTVANFSDYLIDGVDLDEISVAEINSRKFNGFYNFANIFGKKIKNKVFNLLKNFEFESAAKMDKLSSKLLESYNKDRKTVTRLVGLSARTKEVLSLKDIKELDSYRATLVDPLEIDLFKSLSSKEITPIYQGYLKDQNNALALRWFGRMPEEFRPNGWQESMTKSVSAISKAISSERSAARVIKNWPFDDSGVQSVLDRLSTDETVKNSLGDIYSWQVREQLKANQVSKARHYYEKVLTVRKDPNPENKKLRSDIVGLSTSPESLDFALGRIEEMKSFGEEDMSTKMFLMKQGKGGGLAWLIYIPILLIGVPLIAFLIFKIISSRQKASNISYSEQAAASSPVATPSSKPSVNSRMSATSGGINRLTREEMKQQQAAAAASNKKKEKGYTTTSSRSDEYSTLLAEFGLDDSAGPAEIKKAYRNKIKEYHPDVTELEEDEANQKLNEIKQTYNRLQKFQGSLFGVKK